MPYGASRAVRFVVHVVDGGSGLFNVRLCVRPVATLEQRRNGKRELREEHQQQSWSPSRARSIPCSGFEGHAEGKSSGFW